MISFFTMAKSMLKNRSHLKCLNHILHILIIIDFSIIENSTPIITSFDALEKKVNTIKRPAHKSQQSRFSLFFYQSEKCHFRTAETLSSFDAAKKYIVRSALWMKPSEQITTIRFLIWSRTTKIPCSLINWTQRKQLCRYNIITLIVLLIFIGFYHVSNTHTLSCYAQSAWYIYFHSILIPKGERWMAKRNWNCTNASNWMQVFI